MTLWNRVLRRPQSLWIRKAMFQIHLWTGIAVGIYVVVICVSGSALVFRNELTKKYLPGPTIVAVSGPYLSDKELAAVAVRAYPDHRVTDVWPAKQPNQAVEIWMTRNGHRLEELFDPYTGKDLGGAEPAMISLLVWLGSLHDELLYGETGRTANGIGGLVLTLSCLTGAFIWWPGIGKLRRSLTVDFKANWKRINWSLHSAIGFWLFLPVFLFAFTGFYLVFQEPFMAMVDYFEPVARVAGRRRLRTGDLILRWLARLHFGRYWGWPVEALWVVLGLIPPVLFITGTIMWWQRVLRPQKEKFLARRIASALS